DRVDSVGLRVADARGEEAPTAEVRRAERDAVHAREIPGTETGGIAVDEARAAEAFRLRLVERDERRAARIADEHDPLVAAAAEELHARAEILDHALHEQHRVVVDVARVEPEASEPALRERRDQVVPHEVRG